MKNKDGRRTYWSLADGDGTTAASVQKKDPISQQCCREKRQRQRRQRRCRASPSVGAGVEQVDGGADSLFLRPAMKCKGQRD
jgi:hypothetical protein